jgi:hypothetical protein
MWILSYWTVNSSEFWFYNINSSVLYQIKYLKNNFKYVLIYSIHNIYKLYHENAIYNLKKNVKNIVGEWKWASKGYPFDFSKIFSFII